MCPANEEKSQTKQKDCLFCDIARGDMPSTEIYSDDQCMAFKDINPVANIHVLIVPRDHINRLTCISINHENLLGHMLRIGAQVAQQTGIAKSGYRLTINQGNDAGQIVDHLHIHLLGGGQLERLGTPIESI